MRVKGNPGSRVETRAGFGPPSRRTVIRTAAWTVPVIAVAQAAPAFALSPCPDQTIAWSSKPGAVRNTSLSVGTAPNTLVTMGVTAGGNTAGPNTLLSSQQAFGGTSSNLQLIEDMGSTAGTAQTVTLTFTPPVTNLRFALLDIDSNRQTNILGQVTNAFYDNVTLDGTFTGTSVVAGNILGNGSVGNAFRYKDNNTGFAGNETGGNVNVRYPGTVSSVTITYTSSVTIVASNPAVAIGDLTFSRGVVC